MTPVSAGVGESRPALSLHDATVQMTNASTREEIGDVLTDYLRSAFGCGLLLIVREGMALGWKGFSPAADASAIESVAIPLTAPSMLSLACEGKSIFRGAPPADGAALQGRLYKLLRCAAPREALVAPVVLKERVVNLVYVHAFDGGILPDTAVVDLTTACAAVASAFVRLIQSTKTRPNSPG